MKKRVKKIGQSGGFGFAVRSAVGVQWPSASRGPEARGEERRWPFERANETRRDGELYEGGRGWTRDEGNGV